MMTADAVRLPLHAQLAILWAFRTTGEHAAPVLAEVAAAVGVSQQTLINLLQGRSDNPRLETLRGLCAYFGISLDYFACATADDCRAFLLRHALQQPAPMIDAIHNAAQTLSPRGQRHILTALEWMRVASASSR